MRFLKLSMRLISHDFRRIEALMRTPAVSLISFVSNSDSYDWCLHWCVCRSCTWESWRRFWMWLSPHSLWRSRSLSLNRSPNVSRALIFRCVEARLELYNSGYSSQIWTIFSLYKHTEEVADLIFVCVRVRWLRELCTTGTMSTLWVWLRKTPMWFFL